MMCIFATLACFMLTESVLVAQENAGPVKVGDQVVLKLTGEIAKEYARRSAMGLDLKVYNGIQIETSGRIVQKLADGRIRVENSSPVNRDGQPQRLITLTATVDPAAITTRVIPKGSAIASHPGAQTVASEVAMKNPLLQLSDLKNVKLRTWTLSEEIGE